MLFHRSVKCVHVDVQNHEGRLSPMIDSSCRRILFVCTGNICRSPTAEGVLRAMLARDLPQLQCMVDSAGTQGHHVGESPDPRTVHAALRRGYDLSGLRARRVTTGDFNRFDIVFAMDEGHLAALEALKPSASTTPLACFLDAWPEAPRRDVPDPYYGGPADFELVLDLVESASRALIAQLR